MRIVLAVLLALLCHPADAITVEWQQPATYTDGRPLALNDLSGYTLHFAATPNAQTILRTIDVPVVAQYSYDHRALELPVEYFLSITARANTGERSDQSNQVKVSHVSTPVRVLCDVNAETQRFVVALNSAYQTRPAYDGALFVSSNGTTRKEVARVAVRSSCGERVLYDGKSDWRRVRISPTLEAVSLCVPE